MVAIRSLTAFVRSSAQASRGTPAVAMADVPPVMPPIPPNAPGRDQRRNRERNPPAPSQEQDEQGSVPESETPAPTDPASPTPRIDDYI